MSECSFDMSLTCVQETWNRFENQIINVVDNLTPLAPFVNDSINESSTKCIKNLIDKKKRLLKKFKSNNNPLLYAKIKEVNTNIKQQISILKTSNVRRGIIPGNSKSLWNAVKKAKDLNVSSLPDKLTLNSLPVAPHDLPDTFAEFFSNKVTNITSNCRSRKINCDTSNFITSSNIINAIKSFKSKNCEGLDRIPVRYLIDGMSVITPILTHLFLLIYETKTIPQQWSIS